MIDTPEITERREELEIYLNSWCELFRSTEQDALSFRIELLMVAVEHAARLAQIKEDYEYMRERLK